MNFRAQVHVSARLKILFVTVPAHAGLVRPSEEIRAKPHLFMRCPEQSGKFYLATNFLKRRMSKIWVLYGSPRMQSKPLLSLTGCARMITMISSNRTTMMSQKSLPKKLQDPWSSASDPEFRDTIDILAWGILEFTHETRMPPETIGERSNSRWNQNRDSHWQSYT